MNNREAVISIAGTSIPENVIDKALIDLGLTPTGYYSNRVTVELATIEVLKSVIAMPDVSEGDYSVKYDRGALLKLITALGIKNNIAEYMPVKSTVRRRAVW